MVHDFWIEACKKDPRLRQQDLRLLEMDLKGAYTLLSFRPSDAGLFAMLLTMGEYARVRPSGYQGHFLGVKPLAA